MNAESKSFDDLLENQKPQPVCVVRVSTSYWVGANGASHMQKTVRSLRKKCVGVDFFSEDLNAIGAEEVMDSITNLGEVEDGVYQLVTCNEKADWETPHIIDSYDYKLIPFVESEKGANAG